MHASHADMVETLQQMLPRGSVAWRALHAWRSATPAVPTVSMLAQLGMPAHMLAFTTSLVRVSLRQAAQQLLATRAEDALARWVRASRDRAAVPRGCGKFDPRWNVLRQGLPGLAQGRSRTPLGLDPRRGDAVRVRRCALHCVPPPAR